MNYAAKTKKKLYSIIKHMGQEPTRYVKNPTHDFVRNRKLSFGNMLKLILSLGANNMRSEMLFFFTLNLILHQLLHFVSKEKNKNRSISHSVLLI